MRESAHQMQGWHCTGSSHFSMRSYKKIAICIFFCSSSTLAQSPTVGAIGPAVNASLGYSYLNIEVPSSARIVLNGVEASATIDTLPRLGVKLDLGYARASNVFGSGYHSDVLSYLAGPVLYPSRHKKLTIYIQGLIGGARVTGPVPLAGGGFDHGYVNKLAWGAGCGWEYEFSSSFAFRVGGDYLHTAFFSSALTIRGQNNFRTAGSIVYFFGTYSESKRASRGN